jgi:creatinine amidohydrolase/Fe(II)-dependent formamide hydrolase-like protein
MSLALNAPVATMSTNRKTCPTAWLPDRLNTGPWLSHYTVDALEQRGDQERIVLPICSWDTPIEELERLGTLVLSPLYVEALDPDLTSALLTRIAECFPYVEGSQRRLAANRALEVVELPRPPLPRPQARPRLVAFSVDTAVEEHGPHLPLATDRIQSYAVLAKLAEETEGLALAAPVDYGHLTWGLPRGFSIDVTTALLTRYVARYAQALAARTQADALYVVDVHGSPAHRLAIEEGLAQSGVERWRFRWLHQPLVEFASERGDQHAGGVETALIETIEPGLLDPAWWPGRIDALAAGEMTFAQALELQGNLAAFIAYAESHPWNGIVGRVHNYREVDGPLMLERMIALARQDVHALLALR